MGWDGWIGYLRVVLGIEHLTVLISYKVMENLSKTLNIYRLSALNILKGYVKWHHMFRKGKYVRWISKERSTTTV